MHTSKSLRPIKKQEDRTCIPARKTITNQRLNIKVSFTQNDKSSQQRIHFKIVRKEKKGGENSLPNGSDL